ncbi:hypothetical protein Tco_0827360 [Tanacetum coccineum]
MAEERGRGRNWDVQSWRVETHLGVPGAVFGEATKIAVLCVPRRTCDVSREQAVRRVGSSVDVVLEKGSFAIRVRWTERGSAGGSVVCMGEKLRSEAGCWVGEKQLERMRRATKENERSVQENIALEDVSFVVGGEWVAVIRWLAVHGVRSACGRYSVYSWRYAAVSLSAADDTYLIAIRGSNGCVESAVMCRIRAKRSMVALSHGIRASGVEELVGRRKLHVEGEYQMRLNLRQERQIGYIVGVAYVIGAYCVVRRYCSALDLVPYVLVWLWGGFGLTSHWLSCVVVDSAIAKISSVAAVCPLCDACRRELCRVRYTL